MLFLILKILIVVNFIFHPLMAADVTPQSDPSSSSTAAKMAIPEEDCWPCYGCCALFCVLASLSNGDYCCECPCGDSDL